MGGVFRARVLSIDHAGMKDMSRALRSAISRIRCVTLDVDGVLTDGRIVYGSDGTEYKAFNARDGVGIKMLLSNHVHVAIITGRQSPIVDKRAEELGICHVYQGVQDKRTALKQLLEEVGCAPDEVAHIGDDLPDRELFELVGLSVAVADASPTVKREADFVTRLAGGDGAVREFCDLLSEVQFNSKV